MANNFYLIKDASITLDLSSDSFLDCKVIDFDERYKDEELHNYITNTLNNIENCDGFIIPCVLGTDMTYNSYIGLRLAIHMRLTHSSIFQYWNKPIIFTSFDSLSEILSLQEEKTGYVLNLKGSYFDSLQNYSSIKQRIENGYYKGFPEDELNLSFLQYLHIQKPPRFKSNHSIANEWGTMRLAQIAKIPQIESIDTQRQNIYKSLYFKYLLRSNEINITNTDDSLWKGYYDTTVNQELIKLNKSLNVAIIDDKADIGWKHCIKKILKYRFIEGTQNCNIETYKSYTEAISDNNRWKASYDLIFLDLRLSENSSSNYDSETENSFRLLKKIKEDNPSNSVIIFTASKKAWNRKRAFEAGADGYYVKESPELSIEQGFSEKNYDSLIQDIEQCLNKNKLLKPFWHWINEYKKIKQTLYFLQICENEWRNVLKCFMDY